MSDVRLTSRPRCERRLDDRRGRPIELEAPHQAGAAHVARSPRWRAAMRAQAALEVRADARDVRHQPASISSSRNTSAARQASRLPP